ncbi:hypothetical protein [Streptosporangium pseudovulgare]|uniref:Uncharacterized protein n=1 Tax=Streptosporangium pseudovulgare TaxID=35765 RepID=A0ABQ2R326_9ACTN|nr:hypothetical protein [Streptosporangium pseudovulgare]GGQ11319.1 hypothetical protein GCM10010140_46840 [Streptosporangium pseudovulgare]
MRKPPPLERLSMCLANASEALALRSFTTRALESLALVIDGQEDAAEELVRYRLTYAQAELLMTFAATLGRMAEARLLDQQLRESEHAYVAPEGPTA